MSLLPQWNSTKKYVLWVIPLLKFSMWNTSKLLKERGAFTGGRKESDLFWDLFYSLEVNCITLSSYFSLESVLEDKQEIKKAGGQLKI